MHPAKFTGFLLMNLLVCLWLGYLIDSWTNMSPFWLIALVLYAIIGSFVLLIYRRPKDEQDR